MCSTATRWWSKDRAISPTTWRPPELTELSQVILSALVDEHRLGVGPDGPTFRLVKRHHDELGHCPGA